MSQIPRILNPVAEAVRSLEELALDPVLGLYVDVAWGGVHRAKMAILSDFFKVTHRIPIHTSFSRLRFDGCTRCLCHRRHCSHGTLGCLADELNAWARQTRHFDRSSMRFLVSGRVASTVVEMMAAAASTAA